MAYSGLIANAKEGKCLSAPAKSGDLMVVVPCNPSDPKQYISLKNYELHTRHVASGNDTGQIDTWKGTVAWSGQCGDGNDCNFKVEALDAASPDIGSGPFKFYGWGRQGGNDASVADNNTVTQNDRRDGTAAATWLPYSLLEKCNAYAIEPAKCDKRALADCTAYENYKNPECAPQACSQSNGEFLKKQECRDWCVSNPGKCDAAVASYCDANPSNTEFCGCYNISAFDKIKKQFTDAGHSFNAYCNVTACAAQPAYKTSILANTTCNQQVCIQNLTLDMAASEIKGVNLSCSNNRNDGSPTSAPTPAVSGSTTSNKKKWIGIGLLGGLMLLLMIIIFVVVLSS